MARLLGGGLIALLLTGFTTPSLASDYEGTGMLGFRGGTLLFSSGGMEYFDAGTLRASDPQPRLSGDLVFGYVWSDRLVTDVTVGYGWNRLNTNDPDFWIATSNPLTVTARYLLRDDKSWRPYVGAGGGLYIWSILDRELGPATDPVTFERLRRGRLGIHAVGGLERRFSKHFGVAVDASYHYVMAADATDFPNGFNEDKRYAQLRGGVNVFFSLSERIDTGLPE